MVDSLKRAVLLTGSARTVGPSPEDLRTARSGAGVAWLDLTSPTDHELADVADALGLEAGALGGSTRFHQRTRLVDCDGYVMVVVYGVDSGGKAMHELHLYVMPQFILTVHRGAIPELKKLQERAASVVGPGVDSPELLSRILSTLVSTFSVALDSVDDELTKLEKAILEAPDDDQLERLLALQQRVNRFRRAVEPARDLVGAGRFLVFDALEDVSDSTRRYLRDVAIDLAYVNDVLDSERDRLSSVMDVYMNQVNNRQNVIMRQLTAVSTVFLPLMFITGFFGMNFGFLVRNITSAVLFFVLGVGTCAVAVFASAGIMKKRGWW